jgi:hypothetical protein
MFAQLNRVLSLTILLRARHPRPQPDYMNENSSKTTHDPGVAELTYSANILALL